MAYVTEANGIAINLKEIEQRFSNGQYESLLKDKEVTMDNVDFYLGVLVQEDKLIELKTKKTTEELMKRDTLLEVEEKEIISLGVEARAFIEKMYHYHTITTIYIGGIYASLITPLYYAMDMYKGSQNHYPIVIDEQEHHVLFSNAFEFKEEALMLNHKKNFDEYSRYQFLSAFPVGYLLASDNRIKRMDDKLNVFEERMQHYYHILLSYDMVMKQITFIDKKKKFYLPVNTNMTNYLTKNMKAYNEAELPEKSSHFKKKVNTLSSIKKMFLESKKLNEIYNVPFIEVFDKKTDIYERYEKDTIVFIFEINLTDDQIASMKVRRSHKDKNGLKKYNIYIVDNKDVVYSKIEDVNIYSLYGENNPAYLHYINDLNKDDYAIYQLSNKKWVKVIKSDYKSVRFMLLKDKRQFKDVYDYRYISHYTLKEFKDEFGFDALPAKSKIQDEVIRTILFKN